MRMVMMAVMEVRQHDLSNHNVAHSNRSIILVVSNRTFLNDGNQNFGSKEVKSGFPTPHKSKKAAGMAPGGLQNCNRFALVLSRAGQRQSLWAANTIVENLVSCAFPSDLAGIEIEGDLAGLAGQ